MIQRLREHVRKYGHWWVLGALTLIFLALQYNRFFNILAWADTDDALQYNLSKSIVEGNWLGEYNRFTLIKGVGFPVWGALLHLIHVPLWLGNCLLAILSCAAVVYALKLLKLNRWTLVAAYGLLLFNPMITTRIYRDVIVPSLVLLICAWAIGIFATLTSSRRPGKIKPLRRNLLFFSLVGLIGLPMWYYTREDPIWLMPFVGILLGGAFLYYFYYLRGHVRENIGILCMIALLIITPFIAVRVVGIGIATLNERHYGRHIVNDYFSEEFENAYAALARVKNANPKLLSVPVSYEMRKELYKVSPAFNALQTCLDSGQGVCEGFKEAGPNRVVHDYEGGWFPFAIRLAVEQAGYYTSANTAKTYYIQLAREVDSACESGKLDCNPAHMVAFMQLPTTAMIKPFLSNAANSSLVLSTMRHEDGGGGLIPIGQRSPDKDMIAQYYDARYAVQDIGILGIIRSVLLVAVHSLYVLANPVLLCTSMLTLVAATVLFLRRRYKLDWRLLALAWLLLGTMLLRIAMLAYVHTVSFPTASSLYLGSVYPLMFLFEILSLSMAVAWVQRVRSAKVSKIGK